VSEPDYSSSFDPGIGKSNGTGWATWCDRDFLTAGLCRAHLAETGVDAQARAIVSSLAGHAIFDTCFMEHMQVYGQQKQKGDPNDLVAVAYLEGMISGLYRRTVLFTPHEWKGNLPDDVLAKRIEKRLNPEESRALARALAIVPKSLRHNVYAAVGIGLFGHGRLH
jgi:hypothetical protein